MSFVTKKAMSRNAALLVALLMLVTTMSSGCTSKNSSDDKSSSQTKSTASTASTASATVSPRTQVTFTTLIYTGPVDPTNPDSAASLATVKEKFGVTFKVETIPQDQADQRYRLLAASATLPDIINTALAAPMQEFADEGFLLPLNEDIFKMIPSMKKMFTDQELKLLEYKGVKYQFPRKLQSAYNAIYVRGDWMKKLNLKEPQTMDEFEAMLRAFTYNDPDGNGKNDTYGWGERNLIGGNFSPIFGAYGIIPQFWNAYEGKVYYGFTHPKIAEPLKLLVKWYKDKLIDPEWITTNTDDWWGKIATDKLGAFTAGISSYVGIMGRITKNNPNGNVVRVPAPKGPSGKGGIHSFGSVQGSFSLNKKIKNLDRLCEVIEYLYKEENITALSLGQEGKDYKLLADGGFEWIMTEAQKKETGLGWYPAMLGTSNASGLSPFGNINLIQKLQTNMDKKAFEMYTPVGILDAFDGFKRPERKVNLAQKYGDINSILLKGLFEVVIGKSSVEDYQKFVNEWYKSGGEEITKEANEDYQLMLQSRK